MGRGVIQTSAGAADINERRLGLALHQNYQLDYLGGTNPIYVGQAEPGVLTSAPKWRICFITWDANDNPLTITWADGTIAYTHVWDNHLTYAYR